MKIKALVMAGFVFVVFSLRAQDPSPRRDEFDSLAPSQALQWDDPKWWEAMRRETTGFALGKTDYGIKGPLVDTFRVTPRSSGGGLGRKFLNWPIVSLFVPQPIPGPVRGGQYFAWGQRDQPWTVLADRPDSGPSAWLSVNR